MKRADMRGKAFHLAKVMIQAQHSSTPTALTVMLTALRQLRSLEGAAKQLARSTSNANMITTDQEKRFLREIDCKFPYRDASKAEALIMEAQSFSSNATFCVLYEIVCLPASESLPKQTQKKLLATWVDNSNFPLVASIADLAGQVLDGEPVPTKQALVVMREVATIQGQYAALAVVSHLAYAGSDGADCEVIDALEREIRTSWDNV